jgi:hypothetical protein
VVTDLPGKAVATWTDYTENLQKYGIAAASYPWDTVQDEQAMIGALKDGTVKALVLDGSFLDYVSASNCDLTVVGGGFESYEQATAFPAGFTNTALIDEYNKALANLISDGTVAAIGDEQLLPADASCQTSDGLILYAVPFSQVAGLWIMLGASIGVALVFMLFHLIHLRFFPKSKLESSSVLEGVKAKVAGVGI